jgi:peroxiredoxin
MLLLRDRRQDLERAGIRPFAISRDSPWSHASWAMTLGVEEIPLLSDWNGEATRGFDVVMDYLGMADVSMRSAFLIQGDTVRASWLLGREMPDIDAVIARASSL